MVPFGGWEMPLQYSNGILQEHLATRKGAGLFDISHMGEMELNGPLASEAVRRLATNDPYKLDIGGCQYALVLNDRGGVRDDIIVSKRATDSFLICINAGNADKVVAWAIERLKPFCPVLDKCSSYGQLALQGPLAVKIGTAAFGSGVGTMKAFHFIELDWHGIRLLISRTGYTGEDGIEVYAPWAETPRVWNALMETGRGDGLIPVGLGARDTLRLEAALPLYGHELSEETDPIEAGLGWVVKPKDAPFIGSEALTKKGILQAGYHPARRLAGFKMMEPGIARQGYPIINGNTAVGVVTSGTLSISLNQAIGLAYVPWGLHTPGTEFTIDIRGRFKKATVCPTPFVKKAYDAAKSLTRDDKK